MSKVKYFILILLFLGVIISWFVFAQSQNLKNNKNEFNIVLISVDTLRADHMGIYGYSKNTTPNIDSWFKNGIVFTNMRTQIPTTYPSFAIFMTGVSAFESKIYDNSVGYGNTISPGLIPLSEKTDTLAQILKRNDFQTAAFLNSASFDPELTNLNRGFDTFKIFPEFPRNGPKKDLKSYTNVHASLDWLRNNKDKRFFLWVHLMEPHAPYVPPQRFECKFNATYCHQIRQEGILNLEKTRNALKGCQSNGLSQESIDMYKTLYDGEIAAMDELVGKITSEIEKLELDKNTIVIFYGDHGEGFDHNYYFFHNQHLYDSFTKIPFIIKYPGLSKGKKYSEYLQNTQIFPTLLDFLDISPSSSSQNHHKSFFPLVYDPQSIVYDPPPYLFYANNELSRYAIQKGKYKYIYSLETWKSGASAACLYNNYTEELYDLEKDQGEENNILSEEPHLIKELKDKLLQYINRYDLPPSEWPFWSGVQVKSEDKDVLEQLKSLGY